MTLEQAIDRYTNNAEYERIHGSLQGCLEFRQLAEWLKDYKRLKEQESVLDKIRAEIAEYKDDKVIHAEQNEMIDIVLEILDKYR